jgi:hypothetical protein
MRGKLCKFAPTILTLMVALVFVLSLCSDVLARGSSGGSRSGSSGGSRSFSSSSSSSSSGGWSSKPTSTSASRPSSSSTSSSPSWGGKSESAGLTTSGSRGAATTAEPSSTKTQSKSGTPSPAATASMSKADKALYEQAKTKGTAFKTRDEAVSAFKQQNESKYKNQFSSEPSRRPDYIPDQYTSSSGARYQVAYRPELGGYGYYDSSLGRWMMYSVLADAAMTGMLMRSHGYYYGPPAVHYGGGWGFFSSLGTLIVIGLIVVAVVRISQIRRRQ